MDFTKLRRIVLDAPDERLGNDTDLANLARTRLLAAVDRIEVLDVGPADAGVESWQDLVRRYRAKVEYGHPTPPPLQTAAFAVEETAEALEEMLEEILWLVLGLAHTSRALKETIRLTWTGDRTSPRPREEVLRRLQKELAQAVWMIVTLANLYDLDLTESLTAWGEELVARTAQRYGPPPP